MQSDTVFDAIFRERLVPARVRELGADERSRLRLQGARSRSAAADPPPRGGGADCARPLPPPRLFILLSIPRHHAIFCLLTPFASGAQWLDADDLREGRGRGEGGQFR